MSAINPVGGVGDLGEISVRELHEIWKALESNALGVYQSGINYPLQGQQYDSTTLAPNGELSPLVPQSIQNTMDSTTFTRDDLSLWPRIAAMNVDVTSPLHEYNLVHQHGSYAVDPFFAEGGIAGTSEPLFERKTVRVKYMMEVIQLTDVAIMTGLAQPNPSALALRTEQGTLSLTQKLENLCIWADSALNPNQFDGLYASIRRGAPDNYYNANGNPVTPQKLQEIVGTMVQPELYARPNVAFCDYSVFQNLVNQAATYGRHDQMVPQNGQRGLYYGMDKLYLGTPYGKIEIVPMTFIRQRKHPIPQAMGDGAPAVLVPTQTLTSVLTASNWASADVGYGYWYIMEMYGDRGTAVTAAFGGATLDAAGKAFQLDANDSGYALSGVGSLKYYKLYRARVTAGASAPTSIKSYEYVGSWARNNSNAGDTRFIDYNATKPDTSPIIIGQFDMSTIQWTKFLPFTRRPFPTLDTTMKFGLMNFGALTMKVPTKWWWVDNVGV